MKCDEEYKRIQRRIRLGATRGKTTDAVKRLKSILQRYGERCNGNRAESLDLFLEMSFNQRPINKLIKTAIDLVDDSHTDAVARITCLHVMARLTILSESWDQNVQLRKQALEVARAEGLIVLELITEVNWLDALIRLARFEEAYQKVEQIECLRSSIPKKISKQREVYEVTNRYLTHKAKLILRKARGSSLAAIPALLDNADSLYREAIQGDSENEHFSSNEQIEWAEQLLLLQADMGLPLAAKAETILVDASHSLNAHPCYVCRGYFHQVQALLFETKGNVLFNQSPENAIENWRAANTACNESIRCYEKVDHPASKTPQLMSIEIERKLMMAERPRKIFLSHSGDDKPLVREFKNTLEQLRFEPWLDEDAMEAGVKLERGLLKGFKDSCAAVFFVTSSFKDTDYISTEVEYAIAEKRKKGNHFSIITLVFDDKAEVPELLVPFVWKTPKSSLEALREIIKALPLEIAFANWKDIDTS